MHEIMVDWYLRIKWLNTDLSRLGIVHTKVGLWYNNQRTVMVDKVWLILLLNIHILTYIYYFIFITLLYSTWLSPGYSDMDNQMGHILYLNGHINVYYFRYALAIKKVTELSVYL